MKSVYERCHHGQLLDGGCPLCRDEMTRCEHDWRLVGVTTATDGYRCSKCRVAIEVEADGDPHTARWCPPPPTTPQPRPTPPARHSGGAA